MDIQAESNPQTTRRVAGSESEGNSRGTRQKQRASHYVLLATVLIVSGLVYLLGNERIALWDRDEPRFAQATREMFQGQDFVVPYFNGEYRFDKPVLVYWLMAGNYRLFGSGDFAARFGSSICGVLACGLLYVVGRGLFNARVGLMGSAILAGCPLIMAESKLATADALLAVFLVAGLGLWMALQGGRRLWLWTILLGLVLGLASLTKGPVVWLFLWAGSMASVLMQTRKRTIWLGAVSVGSAVLLSGLYLWLGLPKQVETGGQVAMLLVWLGGGLAVLAVAVAGAISLGNNPAEKLGQKTLGRFGLVLVGMLIAGAVFLPWGLTAIARTDGAYWTEGVGRHVVQRSTDSLEGHCGPPGFYLAGWAVCAFPWSVLGPLAVWQAWRIRRRDWRMAGLLGWVVGPWLVLEVVQTKLVHYVLGCYPAMALLIAVLLYRWRGKLREKLTSKWLGGAALSALWIIGGLVGLVMIVVGIMTVGLLAELGVEGIGRYELLLGGLVGGGVALLTGIAVRRSLLAGKSGAAVGWGFAGVMIWGTVLGGWMLPTLSQYRVGPKATAAAKRISPAGTQFVLFGFDEPSMIWNLGEAELDLPTETYEDVLLPSKVAEFAEWFQGNEPVCAIVGEKKMGKLESAGLVRAEGGVWVVGIYPADGKCIRLWVGSNESARLKVDAVRNLSE